MEKANVKGSDVQNAMIKPVYIKNSEIQQDKSNRISDFEMYESLHLKVGDDIHCIQLERDLWRVYLKTKMPDHYFLWKDSNSETYRCKYMIRTHT